MKPVFLAKEMFEEHEERFIDVLDDHLANGWVYSGDDAFVMAKTVPLSLLRPDLNKDLDSKAWFVYIYTGDLGRVLDLIPFQTEFVAFRRNNSAFKIYNMKRFIERIRR